MYSYIKGIIADLYSDHIVIDNHGIGYEVLQLAGRHGYAGVNSSVRGADNGFGAQPGYEGEAGVDDHLHQVWVESDGRLRLCEVAADVAGDVPEFL